MYVAMKLRGKKLHPFASSVLDFGEIGLAYCFWLPSQFLSCLLVPPIGFDPGPLLLILLVLGLTRAIQSN